MSKYVRKTYRCELLTPMIMSGADQSQAELRAPSIKGALRWWWRALNPSDDYKALRRREFALFGGVFGEGDDQQTKSRVSLSVAWEGKTPAASATSNQISSSRYLQYLAYGASGTQNDGNRRSFPAGNTFVINLKAPKEEEANVHEAMSYLLTFGGLGMKSKNGFGQVACEQVAPTQPMRDGQAVKYAAFGRTDAIEISSAGGTFTTALAAHTAVAEAYYWAKNPREAQHSKRTLDSSGDKNLFAAHSPGQFGVDRKAKAVQLFVQKFGERSYGAGIIAFPYQFEPGPNRTVRAPGGKGNISPAQKRHEEIVRQFMSNVRENANANTVH